MNNGNEVVHQEMEWSNMEALAHTLKKNDSERFRGTIPLNQTLTLIFY
jgi:hypothetical protein